MKASVSFQGSGNMSPAVGTHKSGGMVGESPESGGGVFSSAAQGVKEEREREKEEKGWRKEMNEG